MLLLLTGMAIDNIATAQIPSSGLIGYWPFNGNATDESGNGNHGILAGQTQNPQLATDRFGNPNSAYEFGGYYNKNWIRIQNSESLLLDRQMTVSLWFQQCEFAGMDGYGRYSTTNAGFTIFSKAGDYIAAYPGFWIGSGIDSQTAALTIGSANKNTQGYTDCNYSVNIQYNCFDTCEWVHYVSIIDDTVAKAYVNGVLYTVTPINRADYYRANTQDIYIGRMGCNGTIWYPFNGKIDYKKQYHRSYR